MFLFTLASKPSTVPPAWTATEGTVGSNNEIRRLSKQITAFAIAIEVGRYETDVLRDARH